MELPIRTGEDRFLPAGRYRTLEETLKNKQSLSEVRSLIVSAFDFCTRIFPFAYMDWYLLPCGPRAIAASLISAGLPRTRFSYQLWNPNLQPSKATVDGEPINMLLVSAMQVHAQASYDLIIDAWSKKEDRPLIIAGGPKACYEPFDYFGLGPNGDIGADVVVTGEEAVLMELLNVLSEFGAGPGKMKQAFQLARKAGALSGIPGLVYSQDDRHDGKNLHNTGVQRLVQDLDELPMPLPGFMVLEPPHRKKSLVSKPMDLHKITRSRVVTSLLITRGCRFHCHYCCIPAYNHKSFRRKSVERVIEEFTQCKTQMDTRYFFGADDNFFNDRKYAEKLFSTISSRQFDGRSLGSVIRFGTESTVIDAYKCRDLFPMARYGKNGGGLSGLWLGVEDLSGTWVRKGQNHDITRLLFSEMKKHNICPMVMIMHHDGQPLEDPKKRSGLIDQVRYLKDIGAVSMQITVASPAYGSRWINDLYTKNQMYSSIAGRPVVDSDFDGIHVIVTSHSSAWQRQINILRGYLAFYNPVNLLSFLSLNNRSRFMRRKLSFYQLWGMLCWVRTCWGLKGHLWRLWKGPIEYVTGWPEKYRRPGSPYTALTQEKKSEPPIVKPSVPISETKQVVSTYT
jgi:radical SAM superfamily enzyme YgiQ (UPF0313 family)